MAAIGSPVTLARRTPLVLDSYDLQHVGFDGLNRTVAQFRTYGDVKICRTEWLLEKPVVQGLRLEISRHEYDFEVVVAGQGDR